MIDSLLSYEANKNNNRSNLDQSMTNKNEV